MKKFLFFIGLLLGMLFLTSCSEAFYSGFSHGYNGYTYIGEVSSGTACSNICANRGYSSSSYDKGSCYCK